MSSTGTGSGLETAEAVCTGLVRRVLNLPRTIQRAVDQGLNLTRPASHHRLPPPHHSFGTNTVHEEWAFLAGFEQGFGVVHPFFYACRFVEALKMAREEHKLVFMYLHAPTHPFTPGFCRETLCSEVVVQFLDTNFVSWGGLVDRGDGLYMATTLRPAGFPFCAVVVPTLGDGLIVVQRMEGPVSTAELVEILQRAVEEQGSVCGGGAAAEEEKRRSSGEEDDNAAYFTSLRIHQMSKPNHQKDKGIAIKKEAMTTKEAQPDGNGS